MMQMVTKNYARTVGLVALTSAMAFTSGFGAIAQSRNVTLDSGTVIPVRLNDKISSNESQKGDTFTATVRPDDGKQNSDYADYTALPVGTKVEGVVRMARAKNDKDPGVIDLEFKRVRLPDGRSYPIEGSLIGLDEKSVTKTSNGRLVAKPSHKNDRLTYVGYGAGAGLLVGILTKRTLEDTLLGGGLGYLFGSLQKGHSDARDVTLKQGTELGLRLDRQLSYAAYNDNGYQNGERNTDSSRFHRNGKDKADIALNNRDNASDNGNADSTANNIGVLVGDRNVEFSSNAQPIMTNNVVLVPAGPALSAAHISYKYDGAKREFRANSVDGVVRVGLNSRIAVVNGNRRVRLEAPARNLNGTFYVPLKFLELATGSKPNWDESSQTVIINPVNR